jgi:hypothetical protein
MGQMHFSTQDPNKVQRPLPCLRGPSSAWLRVRPTRDAETHLTLERIAGPDAEATILPELTAAHCAAIPHLQQGTNRRVNRVSVPGMQTIRRGTGVGVFF